tara:strand:- start:117 stop:350 length:234 start_codon:yes stop_codon:yes gene_type:complete
MKFKETVIGIFAAIGIFTVITGFTTDEKEVGRYQIAVGVKGVKTQLYRVDTKTGIIVDINERALEKVRKRNKNTDKQ